MSRTLQQPLLRREKSTDEHGTPLSSVINLTATAAGTGMLTLPFAWARCGLARCTAILMALAVTTDVSLVMLVRIKRATGLAAFGGIMQTLFGSAGSRSFQVLMASILFFALTSMQRVVLDLLPMFLEELLGFDRGSLSPRMVCLVVNIGVLAACSSKTFHGLRFSSGAALACLMPFVVGILWRALGVLTDVESPRPEIESGTFEGLVLAPPLLASSLLCHFGILEMDAEMKPKYKQQMYSVIHWVTLVILPAMYVLVGVAGVVILGNETPENVLMAFESDRLMQLARGVLSLTNALRMPLMVKPLHSFLRELAGRRPPGTDGDASRIVEVVGLLVGSLLLAQWMLALTSIMGLLGGTAGVLGCYCMPGLMYLRLERIGAVDSDSGVLRAGAVLVIAVGMAVVILQPLAY
jgi:amino acid permease